MVRNERAGLFQGNTLYNLPLRQNTLFGGYGALETWIGILKAFEHGHNTLELFFGC